MAQLRRDFLIQCERHGQAIFDALGAQEKELLWIEESNQHFYATTISANTRSGCSASSPSICDQRGLTSDAANRENGQKKSSRAVDGVHLTFLANAERREKQVAP